ncbi:MAG: glycoside hydrolase family 3 protein [Anaerolineae bacterium]
MLSLHEKIGQMLMVGFDGLTPPDYILDWLVEGRITGVVLFARNVASPEQLATLTRACHAAARRPILIGIDQEGGLVARLRRGFSESPGAMALSAAGSEALAYDVAYVLASEMRALGINWNYAPVVDLIHDINNPSVGTRSLGKDPARVSGFATAQIEGFQSGGVAACAKHFPGLGNTPVDTHLALAVIDDALDDLLARDLIPFDAALASGVETVMTTHVKFPAIDPEHPATLSPRIIQYLLRERLGYQGVVATDCMEMRAITDHYGVGRSVLMAAQAGVDVIHMSHTRASQEEAYNTLLDAAERGILPLAQVDAAVQRIQRLKQHYAVNVEAISPRSVYNQSHQATMQQAARQSLALLKANPQVFPVDFHCRVAVVEFASYMDSEVMEQGGDTAFVALLRTAEPNVQVLSLRAVDTDLEDVRRAQSMAGAAEVFILVTRNAHMIKNELHIAQDLLRRASTSVLVCLKNPFDADVLAEAGTILCTFGDSTPSLQAAIDALRGLVVPQATLPL